MEFREYANEYKNGWVICGPIQVLLWIKIVAFAPFHAFAVFQGKLRRLGRVTFKELRKRVYAEKCSLSLADETMCEK